MFLSIVAFQGFGDLFLRFFDMGIAQLRQRDRVVFSGQHRCDNGRAGHTGDVAVGLPTLISNIINLALVVGGIMVFLVIVFAGFEFITAAGDPKKLENAWNKIWQALLGLVIIAASMALITIFENLFGIDIRNPIIYGPG